MNTHLPIPNSDAQSHSDALLEYICEKIQQQDGSISFKQFMDLALYAPGLGYYSAGSHKLGEAGDFITAPEVSTLFGATIAEAITPVLETLPQSNILEVGAGSGALAISILQYLKQQQTESGHYYVLEVSADLRERQRQKFEEAEVLDKVIWLDTLPENFIGVVLGNEVLDAMPVNLIEVTDTGFAERFVAVEKEQLVWKLNSPSDLRLQSRLSDVEQQLSGKLPAGFVSEINLAAEDWISALAQSCQQAYVLLIDYGFPRHEYYHLQRQQGTLMCHYRHHSHDNPFQFLGLQDITAHVDFTAIADAALESDLSVAGYTTQAHFLLGSGLMEIIPNELENITKEQLALHSQIKKLTLPHEMGELFKVIGLQKGCEYSLPGFQIRDMRGHL